MFTKKSGVLSGNALKIIAAATMFIDHIGYMLFPNILILRIIGRLSFPIFAFMIAEGCRYTKNKLRYFLTVFSVAFVVQLTYYLYDGDLSMGILVTFSLSIPVIYLLQFFKKAFFDGAPVLLKVSAGAALSAAIVGVYVLTRFVSVDYGFFGCMMPVAASLLRLPKGAPENGVLKIIDSDAVSVAVMAVLLAIYSFRSGWVQPYSLFAIPLLLLYSGERGKFKMKYFFYIFYVAHFLVIELIRVLFF